MSLESLDVPEIDELLIPLPDEVRKIVIESQSRIDEFVYARGRKVAGFISSDFAATYAHLQWLVRESLAPGERFCEWGCGFGTVALLAETLGFESYGLDVDEELIEQAIELRDDLGATTILATGSLVPDGGGSLVDDLDTISVDTHSRAGYSELGRDVEEFDLIYAYPWPGEERFLEDVFATFAAPGALLLTYHGLESLKLQRKRNVT